MNHRERVRMALEHKKTDRVPIDFGSTANTGITIKAYESLKRYLGIKKPTLELDKVMQVAKVDEEVLELFDVDTRGVHPKPSGNKFLKNGSYEDMWGILRTRPKSSMYYDVIQGPFQYNFSISDLDKFNWPDGKEKSRIKGVREEIISHYDKGYAVVVNMRVAFIEFSQLRNLQSITSHIPPEADSLKVGLKFAYSLN